VKSWIRNHPYIHIIDHVLYRNYRSPAILNLPAHMPVSPNYFLIFLIFSCAVNLSLLLYVSLKFFKDRSGKAYLPVAISIAFWSIVDALCIGAPNIAFAGFWERVGTVPAVFVGNSLINFVLTAGYSSWENSKLKQSLLFLPALILAVLILFTPIFDLHAITTPWGFNVANTTSYVFLGLYVTILTIVAVVTGVASLKKLNDRQKTQMKYFIFGFLIPLIGGAFTEVITPMLNIHLVPLTTTLSGITSLVIIYAIQKYSFLTISPALALEQVFNTIHDAIIVTDQLGKIVLVNTEITSLTGQTNSQLFNQSIESILQYPDSKELTFTDLLNTSWQDTKMAVKKHSAQGSIPVLLSSSQVMRGNALQGLVLVARDISQTDELVHHLEEKTRKLEEAMTDLKHTNDLMVGRELRIVDLKNRISELESAIKSSPIG
jgi:PAS domain S-box-containing protein